MKILCGQCGEYFHLNDPDADRHFAEDHGREEA